MTRLCNCPKSAISALESDSQKIQLVEDSCKSCGGLFLVDGIGPVSASMLSSVDLEVSDSISPDLSWTTVTKGRRSRKPVSRNVDGVSKLGSRSPKRVGDFLVSDADKFDESSTGCNVTNKAEHLPLKKRRSLLQSPSAAPQSSSLYNEKSRSPQPQTDSSDRDSKLQSKVVGGSASANFRGFIDTVDDDGGNPEAVDRKLYNPDDFSGIALLAVAACIDGMDDDTNDFKKGLLMEESPISDKAGACTSTELAKCNTSVGPKNSLQEDVVLGDETEYSSADNAVVLAQSIQLNDENETLRASSKVDRLHWDLNVVMDAWEQPCNDSAEGASEYVGDQNMQVENLVGKSGTSKNSADTYYTGNLRTPSQTEQIKSELVSGQVLDCNGMKIFDEHPATSMTELAPGAPSIDVGDQCIKVEKLEGEGCETGTSKKSADADFTENSRLLNGTEQQIKSELVSGHDGASRGMAIFDEHITESLNEQTPGNEDAVVRILPDLGSPGRESHHLSCVSDDKDLIHMASENVSIVQESTEGFKDSISTGKVKVGMENIGPEVSESSAHESDSNNVVAVFAGKTFEIPDNSASKLDKENPSCVPSQCKDSSVLGASTGSVVCTPKGLAGEVSVTDTTVTESLVHVVPKVSASINDLHEGESISAFQSVSCQKDDGILNDDPTSCSAKIGSILDDCHNSDISHDEPSNKVGSKDETTGFQDGYDSPYEDGELRVSMSCPWEENEIEIGDNECVDYESDGREGMDSDGADYPGSEVVEPGSEGSQGTEKRSLLVSQVSASEFNKSGSTKCTSRICHMKEEMEKIETGGMKSSAGSGTTMEQLEHNDDNLRRHSSDRLDATDTKGSQMEEINSRLNRGKLQSRVEGSASQGVMGRPDTGYLQHTRSRVYSRPTRDVSPEKFMGRHRTGFRVREGNGEDEQWGGRWDFRNCFTNNYHGPDNQGYSRHRSMIADSTDKFRGLNSQDHEQSLSYPSKGLHRIQGRRSQYDRDDYYAHQLQGRPNRSRGSSGTQGVGRGFRDEYSEPIHENRALSSGRVPRYLSRRDRDFSPPPGRVPQSCVPRRKSRSRSRSPRPWHPPHRERGQGVRRHSRSPDFRSEGRVERVRMPFQKTSFPGDYPGSVMSPPPRGRFSPQRNCRWVDDQDYVDNCLRHRRSSPVRMFRRGQRFDSSVGSSGRLKADDYYRPGRYPPIAGAGRGCKYEDSYDDRRRDDRADVMHRTRLSDAGRFRHDAEDNFDAHNDDDGVRNSDLGMLVDRNVRSGIMGSGRGPVRLSADQYRYS